MGVSVGVGVGVGGCMVRGARVSVYGDGQARVGLLSEGSYQASQEFQVRLSRDLLLGKNVFPVLHVILGRL